MIYTPIKPIPELALNLNIILDVSKLNVNDIDYIYTHLYHMIKDFENVYGFLLVHDKLNRKRSRENNRNLFTSLFHNFKKIRTPPII